MTYKPVPSICELCLTQKEQICSEVSPAHDRPVNVQVLTPFQDATLLQSAWPWKLDLLSVAGAVADLAKAELGRKDQEVPSTTVIPCNSIIAAACSCYEGVLVALCIRQIQKATF